MGYMQLIIALIGLEIGERLAVAILFIVVLALCAAFAWMFYRLAGR